MDAHQLDILQRLRPASYWKPLAKKLEHRVATSQAATAQETTEQRPVSKP
jgi:dihydroorotase